MTNRTVIEEFDRRGVATLTLNRPEKGNAYDAPTLDALHDMLAGHAADPSVRLVVLRGAGKHFCAGADTSEIGSGAAAPRVTLPEFCRAFDSFPKPTVALVHGGCIGGGVAFAACCDVVIATQDAFFALPEVRLGFAPVPLLPFLLRAIQPRTLRRYLMSGERFNAQDAQRCGLVHELCDASASADTLERAVGAMLEASPAAASTVKRALHEMNDGRVTDEMMAQLQAEFRGSLDSDDAREGRAALQAKRKPRWAPKSD